MAGTWVIRTTTPPRSRTLSWRRPARWWPGWSSPARAKVEITSTYTWPDHTEGGSQARVGEHVVDVTTVLEVRADEPVVRVTTSFVNPSRDHRVRVHLPLPKPAATSQAECAFTVVERGLTAEGLSDEYGLPT